MRPLLTVDSGPAAPDTEARPRPRRMRAIGGPGHAAKMRAGGPPLQGPAGGAARASPADPGRAEDGPPGERNAPCGGHAALVSAAAPRGQGSMPGAAGPGMAAFAARPGAPGRCAA